MRVSTYDQFAISFVCIMLTICPLAINFFLDLLENYKGHTEHLGRAAGDSTTAVTSDPAFQQAYSEFKTLLERFADGRSLNGVINAVNNIYVDAQNDSELRAWFKQLSDYVRRVSSVPLLPLTAIY